MSIQSYQRVATQADTPRDLEYRTLGLVTAALVRLQGANPPRAELATALHENRRLWNILSADCSLPENQLPLELRSQIVAMALWVAQYSNAVLRDGLDVEPLIYVNRMVMEGLAR